ncbi:MAG: tetratricopeptide repeat protein, partial [Gemmatimonadaceae bacterium]
HHDHAPGAHAGERIGTVSFPNSGSAAAQRPFLRGFALLHSFEYDDARTAFREAQRADSGFAMAYWGDALTFAQLLWGLDYADSARAALARLGPSRDARLARARTERERRYGAAVEALFDTTSTQSRVRGYVAGLRAVAATYPNDLDARALLAVSLLMDQGGSAEQVKARTEESIALAQSVFAKAPQHPGGAHYLIHAADNPKYAAKGLAAARAYAKIAPDAEHALHMPSHIFVQVGAWDDVVSSNERAWPASRAWVKSHGVPNTELSFHALWWLQYGYLQQGRFGAAKALLDTVQVVLDGIDWATSDAIDARYAAEQFRFSYARESGDWTVYGGRAPARVVANRKVMGNRAESFGAMETYRIAFVAALLGDTAKAKEVMDSLPERAAITRGELAGLLAKARGDTANWIASLEAAAKLDASVAHLGPPNSFPPHELLGDALFAVGRVHDAVAAYQTELELMPNRSGTLLALARAQRKAGDGAGAASTEARLRENWRAADAGVVTRLGER